MLTEVMYVTCLQESKSAKILKSFAQLVPQVHSIIQGHRKLGDNRGTNLSDSRGTNLSWTFKPCREVR